ncbi:SUF system NifU family Fe-S cluster assembly protein [Candidatus Pacearchaeota archaeon]|nr:SUF system NifU family Fe-S cluster assembly protein [Candidatus Pacearchaeota archaeon]|tara:strand:- start:2169 stop:2525 length:357 start_codon:yes stop_codon:yes gene_type:complete
MNIYTEIILDLYKNPKNKGVLENPTHESGRNNPLCGDEIKIQLIIEENKIKDVKFLGQGCAISQASASLLTDKIKNMNVEEVKSLNKENVLDLLHIPISPGRLKCALLSLDTLKEALK